MTPISTTLQKRARAWGVQTSYENYRREIRDVPADTVRAVLEVMGAGSAGPPPPAVQVVRDLRHADLSGVGEVRAEDGGSDPVDGTLPADLPFGYHSLVFADGSEQRLIYSPGRCFLPDDLREWGWALQLYSLRSSESWGIGDLGDLDRFARWSATQGAGAILLNPLHAAIPGTHQQPSPYYPSSRGFMNPLYLRVEDDAIANIEARDLNRTDVIDRNAIYAVKMQALERAYAAETPVKRFDEWAAERGELLWDYAIYASLAEEFEGGPSVWPNELARRDDVALADWRADHEKRVRFHAWVQWKLDDQLERASRHVRILSDLAIGTDPEGADAWLWRNCFAEGVTVGAPPDEFNLAGQDWGLPPMDPWRLRAEGYEPFVQTIRAAMRHGGGVRIDHVMGLFRLFWIPEGRSARDGVYVRYPYSDLLDIVALESHRSQGVVIGEDLGTVEDLVREEMSERRMLSYKLLWFEEDPPAAYPRHALAAVTNHDVPTVAGLWSGRDVEIQEALGQEVNRDGIEAQRARLREWLQLEAGAPLEEVIEKVHALMAESPSALLMATLEDVLGVVERPNFPGTTDERPNWSLPLPKSLEEIEEDELVLRVARLLTERTMSAANRPKGSAT